MNDTNAASPVSRGERIASIDVLRGFALLGILVMNIPFFALSQFGWFDPSLTGGFEGWDLTTWKFGELFFNLKMMAIFSMLFGAGVVIFSERSEAKGVSAGRLHYKRMAWLFLIGMVHAYGIWFGDILVAYAMIGCIVFLFRKFPGWLLVVAAPIVMSVAVLMGVGFGFQIDEARTAMLDAQSVLDAGGVPTDEQNTALNVWADEFSEFYPDEGLLEWERDLRENGGAQLLVEHAPDVFFMQTLMMLFWGIWRVGGLMLLGMGLYKLGVFNASRSKKFYSSMIAIGFGAGLPMVWLGMNAMLRNDFDAVEFQKHDSIWNYYGSILVALGHIGLIMLICKLGALKWLTNALSAVGRMALTNYLMQSILCTFLFNWWGLGLWGTMSRSELLLVVGSVWLLQLIVSPLWLSRFRFGPMEWAWRSLTYWKRQPMRISVDD